MIDEKVNGNRKRKNDDLNIDSIDENFKYKKKSKLNLSVKSLIEIINIENGSSNKICDINKWLIDYENVDGILTRSKTACLATNPFNLNSDEEVKIIDLDIKPNASQQKSKLKRNDSLDSGYDNDSLISFVSQSSENIEVEGDILNDSCFSENINSQFDDITDLILNNNGTNELLPTVKDSTIPEISRETLVQLITGKYSNQDEYKVQLIDCRFPYEYRGGHIINSINIHTCQRLLNRLFNQNNGGNLNDSFSEKNLESHNLQDNINEFTNGGQFVSHDKTIYVFYCEFSSYRAPKLSQCLRGLDRLANDGKRNIYFPNLYVLNKGYNHFFEKYRRQLCNKPDGYVPMNQTTYNLRSNIYNYYYDNGVETCDEFNSVSSMELSMPFYRSEQKQFEREMRNCDKQLQKLIEQRTDNSDIVQMFKFHSVVGSHLK